MTTFSFFIDHSSYIHPSCNVHMHKLEEFIQLCIGSDSTNMTPALLYCVIELKLHLCPTFHFNSESLFDVRIMNEQIEEE